MGSGISERRLMPVALLAVLVWLGCHRQATRTGQRSGPTIGSLARPVYLELIQLEGYGLVGGLPGTGSPECPARVRQYLRRYAESQVSGQSIDVDRLLNSYQAAAVYIEASVPGLGQVGDAFDVKVTALSQSPSTSLDGGWLFTAELFPKGAPVTPLRPSAKVQGPVYIDKLGSGDPDQRKGHIIGGGRLLVQASLLLVLNREDFRTAVQIRDILEDRFGLQTARPVSPRQISLRIPAEYRRQPQRFVEVVKAISLGQQDIGHIDRLVQRISAGQQDRVAEVAIEAVGPAAIGPLTALLRSNDEQTRLAAARCLRNLGSPTGLPTLVGIAFDTRSSRRIEAMDAMVAAGPSPEVIEALRALLSTDDLAVASCAYERLLALDQTALAGQKVSDYIMVDQVPSAPRPAIVAWRSRQARLGLFGQIRIRTGRVVRYGQDRLILDTSTEPGFVLVRATDPRRKVAIGPVRCNPSPMEMIVLLADRIGLGYADLLGVLRQACDSGLVDAQFLAGPLPQ